MTASSDRHPDVKAEAEYLDHARRCLQQMRERAEEIKDLGFLGVAYADYVVADEQYWAINTTKRILDLAEADEALCFGRIDDPDGVVRYIGRRHVSDRNQDAVVIDWRAPVAESFYQATGADPHGLVARRRFILDGPNLEDIIEERFDDADGGAVGGSFVPDPIVAQLGRSRTGEMRDIVSTIHAQQDRVIREALDRCLIVQGGPGTGKTAVALHRAAFLLYNYRQEFAIDKLLIVGPNRLFMQYVSAVLPSLGESTAIQRTVTELHGGAFTLRGSDSFAAARVKGDGRMALVLRKAVLSALGSLDDDVSISTKFGPLKLEAARINALILELAESSTMLASGRDRLRDRVIKDLWNEVSDARGWLSTQRQPFEAELKKHAEFRKILNKLWPSLKAPQILRELYSSKRRIEIAADGILTEDEAALLYRSKAKSLDSEAWTRADIALIDELDSQLQGKAHAQSYAHVIVDEAQDLSDMELRAVARRSRKGSYTVVGDLAQATRPGSQSSWEHLGRILSPAVDVVYASLDVGYRLPGAITNFANRLLPLAAPSVVQPSSVRETGRAPEIQITTDEGLYSAVVNWVEDAAHHHASVGVVAATGRLDDVHAALTNAGLSVTDSRVGGATLTQVTLFDPEGVKGLEFDAVLIIEPIDILGTGDEVELGARALFVALTRAVHDLGIIATSPLPEPLS